MSTETPALSVVIPVYNEGKNIVPVLRGLSASLRGVEHEILVVHDFDEDDTVPLGHRSCHRAGRLGRLVVGVGVDEHDGCHGSSLSPVGDTDDTPQPCRALSPGASCTRRSPRTSRAGRRGGAP